ncbi:MULTISPECIES: SDR family oxidoreductase [unclassified Kitasatospora]|uniref:SDR family oxidoreductase n=1 Tax=unclassified Kitasatospora TaxID=2633591 RepID=UPI00070DDAFA|nr:MULTISPECIES: SDR family oxidoreductase [unclassified Kitasatospora]KQV21728.1 short-chain dehydrogenase [Kitasatospora sp. Root107]KRB75479.1 short-chain dehydrogenase [Kitasatospora sp. Root187]
MARRWLITGCSSGLGLALAEAVAAAGDTVLATARKPATLAELSRRHPDRVLTAALDIRDQAQVDEAVALAADRFGGLDVLVNNAGSGLIGAVEEVSDQELRDQLETLVVGPWRLVRAVLPLLRAQGSGHIVNVSSLAGRMAFPGLSAYVTGKYALEGMSQALAAEVRPFGIRVSVVEPGGFATRYGTVIAETARRVPAYAEQLEPMREAMRQLETAPGLNRPESFAELVLRLVAAEQDTPLRVPAGQDAYAYLDQVEQAARDELAAARAFAELPG